MTTNVKVHVNGCYKTSVVKINGDGVRDDPVVVFGNYDGTPNPGGEYTFHCGHPAVCAFEITEEYLGEAPATET